MRVPKPTLGGVAILRTAPPSDPGHRRVRDAPERDGGQRGGGGPCVPDPYAGHAEAGRPSGDGGGLVPLPPGLRLLAFGGRCQHTAGVCVCLCVCACVRA